MNKKQFVTGIIIGAVLGGIFAALTFKSVKRNAIEIGLDADPDGLAERFVECAIIHITRIEDLVAA